jgi:ribosomal protein S18 acetylase RimI-like enzyme
MEFKKVSPVIFDECVKVIRNSFITVANHFNLTKENAPTNPAFIEIDALNKMYEKNIDMFIVLENDVYIGFVAIEKANNEIYYMEKLAILPEYRHKGYGKKVMDFVVNYVKCKDGKKDFYWDH